jgi:hypothetical protein
MPTNAGRRSRTASDSSDEEQYYYPDIDLSVAQKPKEPLITHLEPIQPLREALSVAKDLIPIDLRVDLRTELPLVDCWHVELSAHADYNFVSIIGVEYCKIRYNGGCGNDGCLSEKRVKWA